MSANTEVEAETVTTYDAAAGLVLLKITVAGRQCVLELSPQSAADLASGLLESAYQVITQRGGGKLQFTLPAPPDDLERIKVPAVRQ